MGRHSKQVLTEDGYDRRQIGYYSSPLFVAQYLANKMREINGEGRLVVDPCVGRGELLQPWNGVKRFGIDVVNMMPAGADRFYQADFLEIVREPILHREAYEALSEADYVVLNPPYNCHEVDYIRTDRAGIKARFGTSAALNMYSLFLTAVLGHCKPGAVVGALTFDSFLTAVNHRELRELIYQDCEVHYLHLCPTDLFQSQGADVRTCLVVLEKSRKRCVSPKVSTRPADTESFKKLLVGENFTTTPREHLVLGTSEDNREFLIETPPDIRALFENSRLGNQFPCITGISTGNDKAFLRPVPDDGFSVPFYKNPGRRKFFAEPDAYLTDEFLQVERKNKTFLVRNKDYLFKGGITCSSMGIAFSAAYLPKNAAFGVNANIIIDDSNLWWLLAYLNSSLVTYMVRSILIRTNMITSGYVSRIPVVDLSDAEKEKIGKIAKAATFAKVSPGDAAQFVSDIDEIVFESARLCRESRHEIKQFCADLLRLT